MDEPTNLEVYKSFLKLTPFEQRSHLSMGSESSCPDFSKIKDEALRKGESSCPDFSKIEDEALRKA